MLRHGSTGDEIIIDKDIFDQMYDTKNPLPDRQDYASLEKYYKNKKIVYNQVQETMNRRYKEKFFRYLNKLDTSQARTRWSKKTNGPASTSAKKRRTTWKSCTAIIKST